MNTVHLVAVIAISVIFIPSVFSIKCFQCSSFIDPQCADIQTNDTSSKFFKHCEPVNGKETYFCRKIIQTVLHEPRFTRITRSCGHIYHKKNESYCKNADTDFKKEKSCQCFTEACNSAPSIISRSYSMIIFPWSVIFVWSLISL